MPHKDAKNGNPTTEEQVPSFRNHLLGFIVTALVNCDMPYARTLYASANSRINFEDNFKCLDHGIRKLAEVVYWLEAREKRCRERVERSFGVVTAQQVMTYLTDRRRVVDPLSRSQAHDLTAQIATQAWEKQVPFIELLLQNQEITNRIDEKTLRSITNPLAYIGESKAIIDRVVAAYCGKKTFER